MPRESVRSSNCQGRVSRTLKKSGDNTPPTKLPDFPMIVGQMIGDVLRSMRRIGTAHRPFFWPGSLSRTTARQYRIKSIHGEKQA